MESETSACIVWIIFTQLKKKIVPPLAPISCHIHIKLKEINKKGAHTSARKPFG